MGEKPQEREIKQEDIVRIGAGYRPHEHGSLVEFVRARLQAHHAGEEPVKTVQTEEETTTRGKRFTGLLNRIWRRDG